MRARVYKRVCVCMSFCLSICLSVSVFLSVCLSVCVLSSQKSGHQTQALGSAESAVKFSSPGGVDISHNCQASRQMKMFPWLFVGSDMRNVK